jgi:hypothetical protein
MSPPGRVHITAVVLIVCAAHVVRAGEASGGAALNVNSVRDQHHALLSKRASLTNEVAVRSVEIPRNMLRCGVVHNKLSLSLSESLSTLCGRTMCSYVHSVELMCFELEARESS